MPIALRDVAVPDFGVPLEAPRIPATTYEKRCREAYERADCDWLVVYADRESNGSKRAKGSFAANSESRSRSRSCRSPRRLYAFRPFGSRADDYWPSHDDGGKQKITARRRLDQPFDPVQGDFA